LRAHTHIHTQMHTHAHTYTNSRAHTHSVSKVAEIAQQALQLNDALSGDQRVLTFFCGKEKLFQNDKIQDLVRENATLVPVYGKRDLQ